MSDANSIRAGGTPDRANRLLSVWAITPFYWPVFSGAAVQAQRLYRALTKEGFEFTVLTARHGAALESPRSEIMEGVRVQRLRVLPSSWSTAPLVGRILRAVGELAFASACALRLLRAHRRIDLLHIHTGFLPVLVPIAHLLRIPVVVKQTMLEARGNSTGARLQDRALLQADKVVTLSRKMTNHHGEIDVSKLEMIPQGVDTSVFSPVVDSRKRNLRKALNLDPDAVFVVFVGSILPRKGVDILVRGFIEAAETCPRLAMILIGQRDFSTFPLQSLVPELQRYRSGLDKALAERGLEHRVTWTGKLPPTELAPYLQAADMFCLPSRMEGVPSAPLEAMSCGLPVVVSSLDGTSRELLTHGREGFIVETEEAAEYAKCFETLVSDPELRRRMGNSGRRRVEEAFSFRTAVERYRQLFRSLAAGGS